jgi:DNA-binding NarL/FixJ family response regulator
MLIRNGIAETKIEQATCAEDALQKVSNSDIVICEYRIGNSEPLSLIKAIRKKKANAKIIVFSAHALPHTVSECLDAGVSAYITKGSELQRLCLAVNEIMMWVIAQTDPDSTGVRLKRLGRATSFTKREYDILMHLNLGATNKEISDLLGISVRTVETHRKNMLRKSGTRNVAALLHFANNQKILS